MCYFTDGMFLLIILRVSCSMTLLVCAMDMYYIEASFYVIYVFIILLYYIVAYLCKRIKKNFSVSVLHFI